MRFAIAAALTLAAASPLAAQAPAISDLSEATPIAGNWTYTRTADGSEATFIDSAAQPQLSLRCTRSTRRLTLLKPANAAAAALAVWTSAEARALPASFNLATARLSAQIGTWDPLLDAIAFSRGRFAVSASGQQALVVPAWGEVARVIEDCRV
jgi:hypothetical protein